jgi:hypothetical protein
MRDFALDILMGKRFILTKIKEMKFVATSTLAYGQNIKIKR